MSYYNTETIRQLLSDAFDDEELIVFCYDHFPEVHKKFSTAMSLLLKIHYLVAHCQRHGKIDTLLQLIAKKNSYQFEKYQPYIKTDPHFTLLEFKIKGEVIDLSPEQQQALSTSFHNVLAHILNISNEDLEIVSMRSGSILLRVHLPTKAAIKLERMIKADKVWLERLGIISLRGVQTGKELGIQKAVAEQKRKAELAILALQNANEDTRWKAAKTLGEIGGATAIPALEVTLQDENKYVRRAAAKALGQIGEDAISALQSALKNMDEEVRWEAAKALGEIGNERAVPALQDALQDENKYVRRAAAKALGQIGEDAISALQSALKNMDEEVRWEAAKALGEIGNERAVPALQDALQDENKYVRRAAAKALGQIGEDAISALQSALKNMDEEVRWEAAKALGEIGDKTSIPVLQRVLQDKNKYVCQAARKALERIEGVNKQTVQARKPSRMSQLVN